MPARPAASTGPATTTDPRRRASRARRRANDGLPVAALEPGQVGQEDAEAHARRAAVAARLKPAPPLGWRTYTRRWPDAIDRSRTDVSPTPASMSAMATARRMSGSGASSPSRWATTRSGTRRARAEERTVLVLDDHQPALDQRGGGTEAAAAAAGRPQRAAQLEGQPDAGPAAGDVVVQVPVEALEPGVEVGRQRHQQELGVERR